MTELVETSQLATLDFENTGGSVSGSVILKYEGKGFGDKNGYLPLFFGRKFMKNFSDMDNCKENTFNDSVKVLLGITNEKVNRIEIYNRDIAGCYKSKILMADCAYNAQVGISLVFGRIGNSDFMVNKDSLLNENKTKTLLGLLPDKNVHTRKEYRKEMKNDYFKENKKMDLEELITFKDIENFQYKTCQRHELKKDEYHKMEFKKDEEFKMPKPVLMGIGPAGAGIVAFKGGGDGINVARSVFAYNGLEIILPRVVDDTFRLKSYFDTSEKTYDVFSILETLFEKNGVNVTGIYFETEIEKFTNDKEIQPYPQKTFVELSKDGRSGIVFADDELPLFLHWTRNVNIKINKGTDEGSSSLYS